MFLRRLKDLREDADLTQMKLAQHLNITQRTYSHYEIGDRDIPLELLIKLADFYNVSLDYIAERTNER